MDTSSKKKVMKQFNEEKEKLLSEVKENAEKRKKFMEEEKVSDYNFFKRRKSIMN